MNEYQIFLVDDERAILEMLETVLGKEGISHVHSFTSGRTAIEACLQRTPDLVVLDIMLPDMEGFEVCREIRKYTDCPILFLTARTSDLDKLLGFGLGGDDYITKPFNPLEVVARIKAQLRRRRRNAKDSIEDKVLDYGRFKVLEHSGELIVEGTPVDCPARELQLLIFFCKRPNRIFARDQLYEQVWGEGSIGDDSTVVVHIRRLREKVEQDPGNPRHLVTVRGLGYKFVP